MMDEQKELEPIKIQLTQLNTNLAKQLSFKRNFLIAVVYGAGYAIGASLIAGIIIAILNWTIHSLHDIPIIGKFIA